MGSGAFGNRDVAYAFQVMAASAIALLTDDFRDQLFQFSGL